MYFAVIQNVVQLFLFLREASWTLWSYIEFTLNQAVNTIIRQRAEKKMFMHDYAMALSHFTKLSSMSIL